MNENGSLRQLCCPGNGTDAVMCGQILPTLTLDTQDPPQYILTCQRTSSNKIPKRDQLCAIQKTFHVHSAVRLSYLRTENLNPYANSRYDLHSYKFQVLRKYDAHCAEYIESRYFLSVCYGSTNRLVTNRTLSSKSVSIYLRNYPFSQTRPLFTVTDANVRALNWSLVSSTS